MTRNTLILWPWLCLLALCFCPALFARTESGIGQLVDSIRLRYAPDGRTELSSHGSMFLLQMMLASSSF